MIQELCEFLSNRGWASDLIDDVEHAYLNAEGTMAEMAQQAAEVIKCVDDESHDYSGEMLDDIVAWQKEVGEIE